MQYFCVNLAREIELDTFVKTSGSNAAIIVKHNSLEHVFLQVQKDSPELGLTVDYKPVYISDTHSVFICTISDNNGVKIPVVGESTPHTLESDIARQYPSTIAAQRAFDRAIIRYLDLPGRVLADSEITQAEMMSAMPMENIAPAEEKAETVQPTPAAKVAAPVIEPPVEEEKVPETVTETESPVVPEEDNAENAAEETAGNAAEETDTPVIVQPEEKPETVAETVAEQEDDLKGTPYEGMNGDDITVPDENEEYERLANTVLGFGRRYPHTKLKDIDDGYYDWLEKICSIDSKGRDDALRFYHMRQERGIFIPDPKSTTRK